MTGDVPSGQSGFGARLRAAMGDRGRLCVGIDPHPSLLTQWGLADTPDGLGEFSDICVEALASTAAVIKPQVAFFERHGSAGIAVLESVISRCRQAGAVVIADAKRGDIGTTMAAYAYTWLASSSSLAADALTVAPYLGVGALAGTIEQAVAADAGVFVLARTSNPEGIDLQTARTAHGSVAQSVVDAAAEFNQDGRGSVGLVVGATRDHGLDLSALNGPILAPGLGAQGAQAADLPQVFAGADLSLLVPSSSREILSRGPNVTALRDAAEAQTSAIERALRS